MPSNFSTLSICVALFILESCVQRLDITKSDFTNEVGDVVVDGMISDEPGPYTVRITRSANIDDILNQAPTVNVRSVTIFDGTGNYETLSGSDGFYQTDPNGIRGEIGKKYHIRIELLNGSVFESIPDELKPVPEFDSLYFKLETFQPISSPTEHGFRIFVDTKTLPETENLIRWKFKGTYKVGICWIDQLESKPKTSDNTILVNGQFKKIDVGYVPIDKWTFQSGKYRVEVLQESLSANAYQFWRIVQNQIEGTGSLFQPNTGSPVTNIFDVTGKQTAQGIFYATSIKRKVIYITSTDTPYPIPSPSIPLTQPCLNVFPGAYLNGPSDWN